MDWQAISFDWNQVRAFLAAAEEGSFSAAARVLGQTQPTLGRQVAGLEEDLGVTLFERGGRQLRLTSSGQSLLKHVRAMRDAAVQISLVASSQSQSIEGMVRITASDIMSAYVLPPVVKHLCEIAPKLEIDVVAANDIRNLLMREADIAIRHVRPEQPELIGRLIKHSKAHFYASTVYLERYGRPHNFDDLVEHEFVSYGNPQEMVQFLEPLGIHLTPKNFRVGSSNGGVAWEFVRHGMGISVMEDKVAEETPGLERLLPDMEPIVFPVWLITHRELHTSRRIRLVYDTLVEFLSDKKAN